MNFPIFCCFVLTVIPLSFLFTIVIHYYSCTLVIALFSYYGICTAGV